MIDTGNFEAQFRSLNAPRPLSQPKSIFYVDIPMNDEDIDASEAERSLQKATEWTRKCVQRHLI